jgi:uncharacterized Zn finger protein
MGRAVKGALLECEHCGVQRVLLHDLVLRVGVHDGRGAVRYRCEGCGQIRLRPLTVDEAAEMAATEIVIEWWEPSREVHERDACTAITEVDMDEWSRLLADDRAFTDVVSTLVEDGA